MSERIRPSARKKTLHNVMHSNLSITDKGCIDEVFAKFEQLKAEIEEAKQRADEWHREAELTAEKLDGAINAQETLQKALAEKTAEILRLETSNKNKLNLIHDLRSHLNDAHSAAIKKFAERLCEGRVSNDPVVIAVKVELEMAGDTE